MGHLETIKSSSVITMVAINTYPLPTPATYPRGDGNPINVFFVLATRAEGCGTFGAFILYDVCRKCIGLEYVYSETMRFFLFLTSENVLLRNIFNIYINKI